MKVWCLVNTETTLHSAYLNFYSWEAGPEYTYTNSDWQLWISDTKSHQIRQLLKRSSVC